MPVVDANGTGTVIDVAVQPAAGTAARIPLKVTALAPWVAPKLPPVMVTKDKTGPELGFNVRVGDAETVKNAPALASPFTVTTT